MNLENFTEMIAKELKYHYGDKAKVEHHMVMKNNGIQLQGICVLLPDRNIAPTIYLNEFYEEYENGRKKEDIIERLCHLIDDNQLKDSFNVNFFADYHQLKNYLVFRLINKERNRELLRDVPYKELQDLAIVCHCLIEDEEIGTGSILIHHHHLKTWGIKEDELFNDARVNSPVMEPLRVHKMSDLVKEILTQSVEKRVEEICNEYGTDQEELVEKTLNHMVEEMEEGQIPMYVLTNSRRYYGAASLAYDKTMEKIATLLNNDFYILPSSVHELIILEKTEEVDPQILNEMIVDVNQNHVDREEWLGDHAYFYSRKERKLLAV